MKAITAPSSSLPLLLLLLLVIHFSEQTRAQTTTYKNISSDTTLTTSGTTTSWLSPSGYFAFGFTPSPANTSLFLLGIWFAKTDERSIVWTANGNSPVPEGSKFNLTSNGQLLLTDPDGVKIFSSDATGGSHAAMLDTGNLVLIDANSGESIWQSFDHPTDTILPSQMLPSSTTRLQSRLSDTDFSDGRFSLYQRDGKLQLSQVAIPTNGTYDPYWSSDQAVAGSARLFFDPSGYVVYFDPSTDNSAAGFNVTRVNLDSSSSSSEFYQRAKLDPDGVFRHYIYPKKSNGRWGNTWNIVDSAPNGTLCMRSIPDDYYGSGLCGYNSFCQMDPGDQKTTSCKCPYNYSFINAGAEYKGCSPDFAAQRCDVDDTSRFRFMMMTGTDWPRSDYEHYTGLDADRCTELCLHDCFCAVAIFRDGECWKKRLPLSNGRRDDSPMTPITRAFIKVPNGGAPNNSFGQPPPYEPAENPTAKKECPKTLVVVVSSLLGGSVLANLILLAYTSMAVFYFSRKRKERHHQLHSDFGVLGSSNLLSFTYKELLEATGGFHEEVGRGAFGIVYKGLLKRDKYRPICIAVKKLDKLTKDAEKEFMAEVGSIGQTHHKNLVRLIGFCNEGENRLLVYEFMSNGSLTSFLFGDGPKPEWNKRVKIIFGIAKGLLYLHDECASPIIHCDIKSQNILLDDNMAPRISDFGLAKLLRADQTRTNTGIRGTKGYVAPEWFKSKPVTTKVDVYSFGVLLLEIICCRKNLELEVGIDGENAVLVYWACDCYRQGRLDLLVEEDREALMEMRRLERFVMVAIWCIQEDPSLRPSMEKVTQMLQGFVDVPVPPDPDPFLSSI